MQRFGAVLAVIERFLYQLSELSDVRSEVLEVEMFNVVFQLLGKGGDLVYVIHAFLFVVDEFLDLQGDITFVFEVDEELGEFGEGLDELFEGHFILAHFFNDTFH